MGIVTGWGNWQECPRTTFMQGSYLKTALWFTWRINHIPPPWTCWGCCWSRKRTTSLHVPITLHQPRLGRAMPRSQRSVITDSQLLKRGTMDIQSAQLNWMLPRLRWHSRRMPQYSMTPWMPWKVGTMTDSSSVSSKQLQSVNPRVAISSTARKKVTIGINAKRPSPQSSKNCLTSKTGSERSGRRGL